MNFRGHSFGGLVSASLVTGGYLFLESAVLVPAARPEILFAITYAFALFPDLDTKSTPQKWFFRALFVVALYLIHNKHYELCSIAVTTSIIPLLFKHRGFTHWWIMSIVGPILLANGVEYQLSNTILEPKEFYIKYGMYVVSGIIGWQTHLFLDLINDLKRKIK
jgi:uncharacterized metal-binding protein